MANGHNLYYPADSQIPSRKPEKRAWCHSVNRNASGPDHPVQNFPKDVRTGRHIKDQFAVNVNGGYGRQAAAFLSEFIKAQGPFFFGDDDFFPRERIAVIRRDLCNHLRHIHTGNAMLAFMNHFNMDGFHVRVPEA